MSLLEKILKIEALIQRSSSEGEREAARLAKERLTSQLAKRQASCFSGLLKKIDPKIRHARVS